jgi:hypothetical protein
MDRFKVNSLVKVELAAGQQQTGAKKKAGFGVACAVRRLSPLSFELLQIMSVEDGREVATALSTLSYSLTPRRYSPLAAYVSDSDL